MNLSKLFNLFRKAVSAWVDDFAPSMGAAISYYTMFSLAPLLIIVIAVAGALFGREAVQGEIVAQLSGVIGQEAATGVQDLIKNADEPSTGLFAGLVSAVVLIVGATTVFAELQSALDRIWHVPEREKPTGLWALLRARVLSFGLVLGLAFLLMVSLAVSAGVAAFGSWFGGLMPGSEVLLQLITIAFSLCITTLLFAMIFKFMPTADIRWHDVWIGSIVTAVLFELGKFLISLYLGKSGVTESFAAAGSLVVLLAWVYYAAQIFLLGAEFTKVFAHEHGSVAGAKAVAATNATADAAAKGTDQIGPPAGHGVVAAPSLPPLDSAQVASTLNARRDIDRRLEHATNALVRQAVLLGAVTLAQGVLHRWGRQTRRQMRADTRTAKAGARRAAR